MVRICQSRDTQNSRVVAIGRSGRRPARSAAAGPLRLPACRRNVAGGPLRTPAEEMLLHLLREILAGLLVRKVQPVLVDQHLLVLEPLLPRLFRDLLVDALAELPRIRRKIEALRLALQLDA